MVVRLPKYVLRHKAKDGTKWLFEDMPFVIK